MKTSLFNFCIGILFVVSGCRESIVNSIRTTQEILIDGIADEWKDSPRLFLAKDKISLGLQNNDDNLFLSLRLQSSQTASRLQQQGFIIRLQSFDKTGGRQDYKFKSSFLNPGMPHSAGFGNFMPGSAPVNLVQSGFLSVYRISDGEEDLAYPLESESEPMGAFLYEKGFCHFELRIPLIDILGDTLGNKSGREYKIRLLLQSASFEKGRASGEMAPPAGGMSPPPGGMGNPPGGMGPGPGGRGGMPPGGHPHKQEIKEIKASIIIVLAKG